VYSSLPAACSEALVLLALLVPPDRRRLLLLLFLDDDAVGAADDGDDDEGIVVVVDDAAATAAADMSFGVGFEIRFDKEMGLVARLFWTLRENFVFKSLAAISFLNSG